MQEKVRKELDTLLSKMKDWRNSYLRYVSGEGDDYLIEELQEDINTWMAPYVRRLEETNHITRGEADAFWSDISDSFAEFVRDVGEGKVIKEIKRIDVADLMSRFRVCKDFIDMSYGGHEFITEQKLKLADIALELIPYLVKGGEDEAD
jgi:hypothetical protein